MQKEVVEKLVQKARHCMVMKSTQLTTFTLTLSSTTLRLPTHIMRRYIKLTSTSSIISLVGLSWHTVPRVITIVLTSTTAAASPTFFTGRPKALSAVKPYYTFAVRRTGLPQIKPIFQRRHFCPCPQCTSGDYHRCMYKEFLGRSKSSITFSTFLITTYRTKHSEKCTPLLL